MSETKTKLFEDRVLGGALIGTGFIMVLAMLHHPVINSATPEAAVDEILHEATLNQLVHGVAIAAMLLQLYGFHVFRARTSDGTSPMLSVLLFGAGAAGMVGAALLSGFVTPLIASYMQGGDLIGFRAATLLAHAGNQSLAGFASIALALAGLVSAWPIWRKGGLLRLCATLGALTGLATLGLVASRSGIDVLAMTVIAVGLSLWSASMGFYLMTRRD